MTYNIQLYPWCIIRPLPNMRTQIVGRFRRRGDAEGHLRILKQMIPGVSYEIMFDITPKPPNSENQTPATPLAYKDMGQSFSPLLAQEGQGDGAIQE